MPGTEVATLIFEHYLKKNLSLKCIYTHIVFRDQFYVFMYICMYTCLCICIHTYAHTPIYIYIIQSHRIQKHNLF